MHSVAQEPLGASPVESAAEGHSQVTQPVERPVVPVERLAPPLEQAAPEASADSRDAKEAPEGPHPMGQTGDSKEHQTYVTKYSTIMAARGPVESVTGLRKADPIFGDTPLQNHLHHLHPYRFPPRLSLAHAPHHLQDHPHLDRERTAFLQETKRLAPRPQESDEHPSPVANQVVGYRSTLDHATKQYHRHPPLAGRKYHQPIAIAETQAMAMTMTMERLWALREMDLVQTYVLFPISKQRI